MSEQKRKAFAHEVAIHRRWGMIPRRPRRRLPRQVSPKTIAVEYAMALRAMFRAAFEAYAPLLDRLAQDTVRKDAPGDFPEKVKTPAREAKRLLDEAEKKIEGAVSTQQVASLADKFARRTSTYQRVQLGRQVKAALGADPFIRDPELAGVAEDFVAQNVSLIKRIPKRLHEKVEGMVMNTVAKGDLNVNLRDAIQDQFKVSERHAMLIARDQVAKYYGAVNKARQQEMGLTRFIWRTVNDERVRDSHADLEGKTFSWDDLPTNERDEEIYPGSDYQCFPGNTKVSTDAAVVKLYRRWYSGECTVLTTDDGRTIQTTPNHPVLTRRGWVSAHLVDVGDDVFEASLEGIQIGVQDREDAVPSIEELFHALAPLGVPQKVHSAVGGFHGDVTDENIDVVDVERYLTLEGDPVFSETFCQKVLVLADTTAPGRRDLAFCFDRFSTPARRLVGLGCKLAALVGAGLGHSLEHRLAATAWFDTVADQLVAHGCASDVKMFRDALDRPPVQDVQGADFITRVVVGVVRRAVLAATREHTPSAEMLAQVVAVDSEMSRDLGDGTGLKKTLRIVEKGSREYSGHVYNLETTSGWYVAEGIAVHNCRCSAEPVVDDVLEEIDNAESALDTPGFDEDADVPEDFDDDVEQDA